MAAAAEVVRVTALDHVGLRVLDADRAIAFYAHLGFRVAKRPPGVPVIILRNDVGVELNLIVNAEAAHDGRNVLLDEVPRLAGITHLALRVGPVDETLSALAAAGIVVTEGPVVLDEVPSVFVRDPDRNGIELRCVGG